MLHRKWDKLRPDEPAGSYADLTLHKVVTVDWLLGLGPVYKEEGLP